MKKKTKNIVYIIAAATLLIVLITPFNIHGWVACQRGISNFNECAAARFPVMESYPRQCNACGQHFVEEIERTDCEVDADCMAFGEDGDCNCGCYRVGSIPVQRIPGCFCAAPRSCECVNGECEPILNED